MLPNPERQAECIALALQRAGLPPDEIDIVSTHATGTGQGDAQECQALRQVFAGSDKTCFNNTKSFIGHAMGAAGALELAGNLPAFDDGVCHATINVDRARPRVRPDDAGRRTSRARSSGVEYILNNSFGMLGINSVVIIKKFQLVGQAASLPSICVEPTSWQLVATSGERRMTTAEIREEILDILSDIAPDEDLSGLVDDKPFREQLELDSMDFLDIVMELRKRHRIQIPEEDYKHLASLASTVAYLEPRMKDMVRK